MPGRFRGVAPSSPERAGASEPPSPNGSAPKGPTSCSWPAPSTPTRSCRSLNETAARMARYGNNVAIVVADLTDPVDRQRVIPEATEALGGPVEILVNNAAASIQAPRSVSPSSAATSCSRST